MQDKEGGSCERKLFYDNNQTRRCKAGNMEIKLIYLINLKELKREQQTH